MTRHEETGKKNNIMRKCDFVLEDGGLRRTKGAVKEEAGSGERMMMKVGAGGEEK